MHRQKTLRFLYVILAAAIAAVPAYAASARKTVKTAKKSSTKAAPARKIIPRPKTPVVKSSPSVLTRRTARRSRRVRRYSNPWTEPTYADSTLGDNVDGEDLVVRRAAVDALGPYNGTVVAVDPQSGRILSMVNQRVALRSGFTPCSTVKIPVALAALAEGLIDRTTPVRLYGRTRMDLTEALARSNNQYFAHLGVKLGYDRFAYYARLFGLGEKAGLNIAGEEPGYFADGPPPSGMGMMTSFGDGITLTPLELAALLTAISNGGTLYFLQYPRTQQEVDEFVPRVKRQLDLGPFIPEIKPGMTGAVQFGSARRAIYDPEAPVCGKTGTCTGGGGTTHLGWFGSFSDFGNSKIVIVVLLTGGAGVSGPTAAQITGQIYRNLQEQGYFVRRPVYSPAVLVPR